MVLNFGGVDMANEKTWNARAVDVNLDLVILHFQGLLRRLDCWKIAGQLGGCDPNMAT